MLDISFIRENPDLIKKNCKNRGIKVDLDKFLSLDKKRVELIQKVDSLRSKKNKAKSKPTTAEMVALKKNKTEEEKLVKELVKVETEYKEILFSIPNLTHPDTPIGKDESENKEIRKSGQPKKLDFGAKDHLELGEELNLIDFDAGVKVTGNKFYFLKNEAVLLEQALLLYGIEVAKKHGFKLVATPDLAKTEIVNNMGYQPRGPEAQIYNIEGHDLSLVGTAEITLGGLHLNETIEEKDLPLLYAGISHSFRTEAGAYGKHSKGLYRVHQFTKLELFVYCLPADSDKWHEKILKVEEEIFEGLEVPFRVVEMCSGDLGAVAYRKYDLEAWMPGRGEYGEITSTSNCTDYQARNLNIKYRGKDGQTGFLHMLNGTGIAISRALIAILENHQDKDGSVAVPRVLRKWVGQDKIKRRK